MLREEKGQPATPSCPVGAFWQRARPVPTLRPSTTTTTTTITTPLHHHPSFDPPPDPPHQQLQHQPNGPRRSLSRLDSPSPVETQHSQSLPSISRPNSVDSVRSTSEEQVLPRLFQPPGRPPMRPSLHDKGIKTHSISRLNPPTGTIDAHQSPFLTASTRPSEVTTPHPALPTPPAAGRTHYFPPTAPTPPPNMGRTDMHRPSINFPQSGSASPIAQYSPYSQPASVASTQYDNHSTQGQYGPGVAPMHDSRQGSASIDGDRTSMIAMAPSSQSSIQLMTIKSQHGPPRQIPVETQTASKGADEKRRRNAGASARFRARRKEKEREASMSISRLEQSVRDANEDAAFYRDERDYWRSLALQTNPERNHPRPQSPRLRRASAAPSRAPSSTTGHGSEASFDGYEEESREEEQRNVRRRTGSYHPALGSHQMDGAASGHDTHSYPMATFAPTGHTSGQNSQNHESPQHASGQASGLQHPSPERPMYRDPFTPGGGRYEHRAWSSEQAKGRTH
ncbi:uncharacterized protein SETTUDRAFT_157605 [Exserohilum turcica Et28A]|uniref:BZIP domain-containing protein n=1 Tax=Exserohilum turcicum (strain 28A) TaxID=671987 RepID=R0JZU2_EXST2|nr:uncharacterized protein SETTUDRAFT_157605 [Exserohilum turcica Et28A]EOA81702.1 hypothetical protein SETTUDRAFT_157605 [Exserohilum turcica Et28A]